MTMQLNERLSQFQEKFNLITCMTVGFISFSLVYLKNWSTEGTSNCEGTFRVNPKVSHLITDLINSIKTSSVSYVYS